MFSLNKGQLRAVFICSALFFVVCLADPVQVIIPVKAPKGNINVVQPNFLGISFELSFVNEYFGNDTSSVPKTMINYLSALRSRTGKNNLRIRVGGNSMDSSVYVPTQTTMLQPLKGTNDTDDQPVNYGPMLWDVMERVASDVGGANYLVGLSLLDPNSTNVPLVAGAAQEALGKSLDAFLLGNEVDLYTSHGDRPTIKNYTVADYIKEYGTAASHLTNTSGGNILDHHNLAGPTICCEWNLDALLNEGYLSTFDNILKYISLQHYPQNDCKGSFSFGVAHYIQHANVVDLATWQQSGVNIALSTTLTRRPQVIMSEFNSAACGGIPNISDTFAVGSLWTIDYALQLASVGYTAAHLHTRERGVSYNIVSPPEDSNGPWVTGAPYYALLATAEALHSTNGSIVVDLNINQSMSDPNVTVGGYAVYDASGTKVQQVVLFNFATSGPIGFALPSGTFSSNKNNFTIKYLTAPTADERINISWGGQTLAGVENGELVAANTTAWGTPNNEIDCSEGCMVNVPAPGMAVVFINSTIQAKSAPSPKSSPVPESSLAPEPSPALSNSKQTGTTSGALEKAYPIWGLYTAITAAVIFT